MAMLEVHDLVTEFPTRKGVVRAVNGVTFDLEQGEILAVVGESGSGKSVTSLSIMGLLQKPGHVAGGSITFDGKDLLALSESEMEQVRGGNISMIFQEPMTSLNPVITVGDQIAEAVETHQKCSRRQAEQRVREILELVGIAPERATDYPHQFSGGMKQRVGIARSYCIEPKVLLMDEPFGALDAQTRYLMQQELDRIWQTDRRTIVFVTNNIQEAFYLADRIVVISNCPATVKKEYVIDMPRPRNYVSPEFLALRKEITSIVDKTM